MCAINVLVSFFCNYTEMALGTLSDDSWNCFQSLSLIYIKLYNYAVVWWCPIWGKQRIAGWEPFTATPKGDRRTVAWTKLDAGLGIFPALISIFLVLIHRNCYLWRCLSSCLTIEFCSTLFFLCNHNIHFCLISHVLAMSNSKMYFFPPPRKSG